MGVNFFFALDNYIVPSSYPKHDSESKEWVSAWHVGNVKVLMSMMLLDSALFHANVHLNE